MEVKIRYLTEDTLFIKYIRLENSQCYKFVNKFTTDLVLSKDLLSTSDSKNDNKIR